MNKKEPENYTVISVESRKGGVGKTTAALNLASLLLKRDFSVLLIDMDITGTNISVADKSPFWRLIVNPIKCTNQNKESEYVNLLSLFNDEFMVGDNLPSWSDNSKRNFFIDESRVNLLGSQIYYHSKSQPKYICKPSILFDELHVHWLIEFLKDLCRTFSDKTQKKSVIILDNSPGFIGLAPAIHDWLTDIGPKRGKFLTVSSLDTQDLTSCVDSVDELHKLFTDKLEAAIKYDEMSKSETDLPEFELENVSKEFFLRLASQNIDKDIKQFYCYSIKDISRYADSPGKYHAFVINKVPKEISKGMFSYEFQRIWNQVKRPSIVERMLQGNNRNNISNYFINYDEYIEYQFLQASLSRNENKYHHDIMSFEVIDVYLKNSLKKLLDTANLLNVIENENMMLSMKSFSIISEMLNKYQNVVGEIVDRFNSFNRYNISKIISSEWYPEYPIKTVKLLLNDLLFSMDYPHEKYEMFDDIDVHDDYFEEFIHKFNKIFQNRIEFHSEKMNKQLQNSLYMVIFLSIKPTRGNPRYLEALSEVFALISSVQQERWGKHRNTNDKNESITMFLAHEKLNKEDVRKLEIKQKFLHFFRELRIHPEGREIFISDLYSAICNAQARMIDINNDIKFMITVLRDLNHKEHDENIIFPPIRELLDNVIVKKTVSHNESEFHAKKEMSSASYMENFQSVLDLAIKDWEI